MIQDVLCYFELHSIDKHQCRNCGKIIPNPDWDSDVRLGEAQEESWLMEYSYQNVFEDDYGK